MTVRWFNKKTGQMEDYKPRPAPPAAFHIMPMFQEYRAVGTDNRIVKTRTEHKAMLKEFNAEEVGNEAPQFIKDRKERKNA